VEEDEVEDAWFGRSDVSRAPEAIFRKLAATQLLSIKDREYIS
jgi:hypothetical protein